MVPVITSSLMPDFFGLTVSATPSPVSALPDAGQLNDLVAVVEADADRRPRLDHDVGRLRLAVDGLLPHAVELVIGDLRRGRGAVGLGVGVLEVVIDAVVGAADATVEDGETGERECV